MAEFEIDCKLECMDHTCNKKDEIMHLYPSHVGDILTCFACELKRDRDEKELQFSIAYWKAGAVLINKDKVRWATKDEMDTFLANNYPNGRAIPPRLIER